MLQITSQQKIFIAINSLDFRMGIDGLVGVCKQHLQANPFNGHVFVFRNKNFNAIKVLYYDSQGFWLCQKRLSRGRFQHWPESKEQVAQLTVLQLQTLLWNHDPKLLNPTPNN